MACFRCLSCSSRGSSPDLAEDIRIEIIQAQSISAQCEKELEEITDLVDKFEEDLERIRESTALAWGGGMCVIAGVALSAFTMGASSGLVAAGVGLAASTVFTGTQFFQEECRKNNIRKTVKDKLAKIKENLEFLLRFLKDIMEYSRKVYNLNEALDVYFREAKTKYVKRGSKTSKLTGVNQNLQETLNSLDQVLEILKEIIEDKEIQESEISVHNKIGLKEFRKKGEKFTNEMRKGIEELKTFLMVFNDIKNIFCTKQ